MRIPDLPVAVELMAEAERLNPGPWVQHSLNVAKAAQLIALHLPGLDAPAAYILGYLHDIGRRQGVTGMRHVLDGYLYLRDLGFEDAARICMTHSFPIKDIRAGSAEWDCSEQEQNQVQQYLESIEYTDYDRLLQLCDSLAQPGGFCLIEKRLVDVVLRYGVNEFTLPKWKAFLQIQQDFEKVIGRSIYSLLPGVVENTFGFEEGGSHAHLP